LLILSARRQIKLTEVINVIIALPARYPRAGVLMTAEVQAGFPQGVDEGTKGAVLENAGALGLSIRIGSRGEV
jgi:hypothetical protein